ncbi:MAG: hypothetical protein Q4A21_02980 [bacterium]|nr:hypothetical protein [bacterium]
MEKLIKKLEDNLSDKGLIEVCDTNKLQIAWKKKVSEIEEYTKSLRLDLLPKDTILEVHTLVGRLPHLYVEMKAAANGEFSVKLINMALASEVSLSEECGSNPNRYRSVLRTLPVLKSEIKEEFKRILKWRIDSFVDIR